MSDRHLFTINLTPPLVVITIVLVILKLTHVWDISWWWVFAPLWLPLTVAVGLMLSFLLIIIFAQIVVGLLDR